MANNVGTRTPQVWAEANPEEAVDLSCETLWQIDIFARHVLVHAMALSNKQHACIEWLPCLYRHQTVSQMVIEFAGIAGEMKCWR